MALNSTNSWASKLYQATVKGVNITAPTTVYLSLHTADPTKSGSFTNEVSTGGGSNYARIAITMGTDTNGAGANSSDIIFATAGVSWGTITHVGVNDHVSATTATTMMLQGPLSASQVVGGGSQARVNAGSLTFQIS